ncbi:hypothetical protein [Brevibacterium album]|uniref:hypothetical protein n=1 Tax=Brevibacterium album TaxID=417948 RepID=UPI0012EC6A9C|nr:hypothetical protein [Brevibacterium album]
MELEPVTITALVGAGGVVIGALITTLMAGINSWLQRREDRHLATRQVREEQYFNATEILHEMHRELEAFQKSNSGLGTTPEKSRSIFPWKNAIYRSSDARSAQAVRSLFDSAERVRLQKAKMEIVGSRKAAHAFAECYSAIEEYMEKVIDHIMTDGRFVYSDSERCLEVYASRVKNAVNLFRQDLRTKD